MGRFCRSPATRRVYTSMLRPPQRDGATQTHFPPRPRKSTWHCDITNVISPHGRPPTRSKDVITRYQSSRSPVTRRHRRGFESRFESAKRAFRTRLPQKLTCQSLQNKRFQKSSGNTHRSTHTHTSSSPAKQFCDSSPSKQSPPPQLTTSRFPAPATKCHLRHTSQLHDSLRLPRKSHFHTSKAVQSNAPATKIALPYLKSRAKYCACHEKSQYHIM